MADLGAISLWIALALASYAAIGSVVGKARGATVLLESSRSAIYLLVLVLSVTTLSLVVSFINRDFELAYVARHSDLAMPHQLTWVAFYAGNEGSLLFIAFVLSVMSAIAIWLAPVKTRDTLPYTAAVMMLVMTFFAVFVIFRVMGRDYDASVISAGFVGLGLGATPVGIANMNAITSKYGVSPKAFLVIPLVGAFFIDIANAAVIRFFIHAISRVMSS